MIVSRRMLIQVNPCALLVWWHCLSLAIVKTSDFLVRWHRSLFLFFLGQLVLVAQFVVKWFEAFVLHQVDIWSKICLAKFLWTLDFSFFSSSSAVPFFFCCCCCPFASVTFRHKFHSLGHCCKAVNNKCDMNCFSTTIHHSLSYAIPSDCLFQ